MRTFHAIGALALGFSLCSSALADDAATQACVPGLQVGKALPHTPLLEDDGDRRFLDEAVEEGEATVIKFFDPNQSPTYLTGAKPEQKVAPFVELHERFKDKSVTWVFVALGETTEVRKLAESERSTANEDTREEVTEALAAARAAQFAEFSQLIEKQGITSYEIYVAPNCRIVKEAGKGCTPCVVITRGKQWVSFLAKVGDAQALANLTAELHLAVEAPDMSGEPHSLPASTPRDEE